MTNHAGGPAESTKHLAFIRRKKMRGQAYRTLQQEQDRWNRAIDEKNAAEAAAAKDDHGR